MLRLALCQLLVEGGEPDRNFERAYKMIKKAKESSCHMILFPETIDFAWTHPSLKKESKEIPGLYSEKFCQWAKEFSLYICVGLTEKYQNVNYNSAILINPDGDIVLKHRKINLLEVEFPYYEVGQKLEVIDTPFGKIGLNICADNYKDALHIGHCLARMGAQLILSPSSWTVDYHLTEEVDPYHGKWLSPFLHISSMHNLVIASATSVGYIVGGPYEGKKMVGKSLIVGPNGIIAEGMYNEFASELKVVELNLKERQFKGTLIGIELKKKGYKFELD